MKEHGNIYIEDNDCYDVMIWAHELADLLAAFKGKFAIRWDCREEMDG